MLKRPTNLRPSRKPIMKKIMDYGELLFLIDNENNDLVDAISNCFSKAKLTVLLPRQKKEINDSPPYCSYYKSDFNLTGKIKNDKLNDALSRTYDLVVDLSSESKITESILNKINGTFIIGGSHKINTNRYDLQIEKRICDTQDIIELKNHLTLISQDGNI